MSVIKNRLLRKDSAGSYSTVHLETSSDLVLRPTGSTVESDLSAMSVTIANKAERNHNHNLNDLAGFDAFKQKLGIQSNPGTSGGNGQIVGSTSNVGGTVTFDNMEWIVVDDGQLNADETVLMMKNAYCRCFSNELTSMCDYFYNYVLSPTARSKLTPHRRHTRVANTTTSLNRLISPIYVASGEELMATNGIVRWDTITATTATIGSDLRANYKQFAYFSDAHLDYLAAVQAYLKSGGGGSISVVPFNGGADLAYIPENEQQFQTTNSSYFGCSRRSCNISYWTATPYFMIAFNGCAGIVAGGSGTSMQRYMSYALGFRPCVSLKKGG